MVFGEAFSAVKRKFGESARATKSYSEESLVVQHKNFEKFIFHFAQLTGIKMSGWRLV